MEDIVECAIESNDIAFLLRELKHWIQNFHECLHKIEALQQTYGCFLLSTETRVFKVQRSF